MASEDLFTGIAVVIDDEIDKAGAGINNLISQIKSKKMPCITFTSIPDDDVIDHLDGISFLLLDWRLNSDELSDSTLGVVVPDALDHYFVTENIVFLKKLRDKLFIPVFIFTDEDKETVINSLRDNDLYFDDKPNYIFVKNKAELKGKTKLSTTIETWARNTPSVYVLMEWGKEYSRAKNLLFHDFYQLGPSWPKVLWRNYAADGVDPSSELGEVITRNIHTRMAPFLFDKVIINKRGPKIENGELRKVLRGERFIEKNRLPTTSIATGDIFKFAGKMWINIRPDCDCIPNRNLPDSSLDDVQLYLLKGDKLSDAKLSKSYSKDYGHFNEQDSQSIIFSIAEGKSFDFRFKEITIKKWSELKDSRIGRLMPPYITRIQQRYALYLQRQALPRTPKEAVFNPVQVTVPL